MLLASNDNLSLTRGLVPRAAQTAGQQSRPKKMGAGGSSVTANSDVAVQQTGEGGKAKRTNDIHFETNQSIYVLSCEVGGLRDKLKADWDGQRLSHMRVQILKASHTKFAEEELKKHLEGRAPEDLAIKTPCMCAGSALGCLRENCPYWCDWSHLVNQSTLKTLKMYYAWCLSKGDGTCHQKDSVWMTDAQKATQKTTRNALATKVQALVNASGFGPPGAPVVATDPSASAVARRTRSTAAGSVVAPQPMTPAQKALIPMPLETAGASVNDDANDAAGPKFEVAQDGRLDDYPVLLPKGGVTLTRVVMEKATWPSETLGNVKIQRMTGLTMQTAAVPTAGQFTLKFLICDGGESVEDQRRKCDTVSMHMAFRVQQSLSNTSEDLADSARKWFNHYGTQTQTRPSWEAVITSLAEITIPEWVWQHEAAMGRAQLGRSQPVSPEQSALLMQDFAKGTVEAKMFVDKFGAFHMSIGVPKDCVLDSGDIADVPIVFRYYTDTHACAAVCTSFAANAEVLEFEENWNVLNPATWKGMTVSQLWHHVVFMQAHFQLEWHAAQSVDEVIQRELIQFPTFIRQMSRAGRFGGRGGEDSDYEEDTEKGAGWVQEFRSNLVSGGSFNTVSLMWPNKAAHLENHLEGMLGWQGTAAQARPRAVGSLGSRTWSQTQRDETAEKWVKMATSMGNKLQVVNKLDQLSRVCMVVKTHQAWGRLGVSQRGELRRGCLTVKC